MPDDKCYGPLQGWLAADDELTEARIAVAPLIESMSVLPGEEMPVISDNPLWDRFKAAQRKAQEKWQALLACMDEV